MNSNETNLVTKEYATIMHYSLSMGAATSRLGVLYTRTILKYYLSPITNRHASAQILLYHALCTYII